MITSVAKAPLLKALQTLATLCKSNKSLPILRGIHTTVRSNGTVVLTSTDLDVWLRYELPACGGVGSPVPAPNDAETVVFDANRYIDAVKMNRGTTIGNAHRMLGDYKKALSYFKKASSLYNKIGDRVSYAYTLWSMGTTYKMLGDYESASGCFKVSEEMFKKTKDPRGLIYCRLGLGELALLEGRKSKAEKYFMEAVTKAKKFGFKVERCHAEILFSSLSGQPASVCYNKLGLKLGFGSLPYNLP